MENSISFTPPRNRGQGGAGESEREVQTEVDIHIRVEGHTLLRRLSGSAVGSHKKVEPLALDVDEPSEAGTESTHAEAGCGREKLHRLDGARKAEIGP